MREPYFPVFKSVIDSTLWSCPGDTIKVFFTLCGKADPEGFVSATADGIRRAADLPLAEVERHLAILASPDLGSKDREREPGKDGRRIEKVVGGWKVLNLEYYRDLARQESIRASKRKWWNENRSKGPRDSLDSSTRSTDTDTDTENETKTDTDTDMGKGEFERDAPAAPPPAAVAAPKPKRPRAVSSWKHVPESWAGPNDSHRQLALEWGWEEGRLELQAKAYRLHDYKVAKKDPDRTFHAWMVKSEADNAGARKWAPEAQ